jgi:hypothetical protein
MEVIMVKENEIALVNRGKIAYLQRENIYQERIEKISRNGKEQFAFIFTYTDIVKDLLKKFDNDTGIKEYNSCFRRIFYDIAKYRELEK